jgi:DNA-binding GntR family transcriptional regulator
MRTVLEEHAGYFSALNRSASDIEAVEEMLLTMKDVNNPTPSQMRIWSSQNREFHSRLFAASGRRHVCRMIGTLRDTVESYIRATVESTSLVDAWEAHEEIFETFKEGDALRLARLCRRHVRHSAEALLDRLRANEKDATGIQCQPAARASAAARRRSNGGAKRTQMASRTPR